VNRIDATRSGSLTIHTFGEVVMANPNVARLHDEVVRLLKVAPTGEGIAGYLAQTGRPGCAHLRNVFASPPGAPAAQRHYDLCRSLPDASGNALYGWPLREYPAGSRLRTGYMRVGSFDENQIAAGRCHNEEQGRACFGLYLAWQDAFYRYGDRYQGALQEQARKAKKRGYVVDIPTFGRGALYLQPQCELPDQALVESLYRESDLRGLIVITARHEVGHLVSKIEQWLAAGDRVDSQPLCGWDWRLITARARPELAWGQVRVLDEGYGAVATPEPRLVPRADLGMLYWWVGKYAQAEHQADLAVKRCKLCRDRLAPRPATSRTGRPPDYCPRCQRRAKQIRDTKAQQRHRANKP
jgi:hypothetical protein